jgi:hypothetical protein
MKFEYKIIELKYKTLKSIEEELNQLGKDYWELISIDHKDFSKILYLKRPLINSILINS